jgi:VWFA-related protein
LSKETRAHWLASSPGLRRLDRLAAETGGLTVGGANDLDEAMQRLLETMSSYYILAYQPPSKGKPGFRRIEVTTSHSGVLVRARRGYEAR